jgi:hypothetical protein
MLKPREFLAKRWSEFFPQPDSKGCSGLVLSTEQSGGATAFGNRAGNITVLCGQG